MARLKDKMSETHSIDEALVLTSLQKILDSETFSRSERLRAFLDYVVRKEREGLAHQLKGYSIGVDVFARNESFDPGGDPLVRVQAGKLRKLLRQYYETEGSDDAIRIEIPVGGYVPVYAPQSQPTATTAAPDMPADAGIPSAAIAASAPPSFWSRFRLASTGLLALTVLNITALGLHATSRYLIPAGTADSAGPAGFTRTASALPRIAIRNDFGSSALAASLADSMRIALGQLAFVELVEDFDRANRIARQPDTLDFTLSIARSEQPGQLNVQLRHNASGDIFHEESIPEADLHLVSERTFAASAFAGRRLSMNGQLYAFADQNALSSNLMRCLTATNEYRLHKSRQTFETAWSCQSQLIPAKEPDRLVSEPHHLISMAREAEADLERRNRAGA